MNTLLLIAAIILVCLIILFARAKSQRKNYLDSAERYINEIFSTQGYRPEVITGFTYGIPTFTLKFKSDKDKEHAVSNGLTDRFMKNIQALCGHLQPRGEVFRAEQAVAIYSLEDEKRWAQKAAAFREKKN
jgi:hypothetical protein